MRLQSWVFGCRLLSPFFSLGCQLGLTKLPRELLIGMPVVAHDPFPAPALPGSPAAETPCCWSVVECTQPRVSHGQKEVHCGEGASLCASGLGREELVRGTVAYAAAQQSSGDWQGTAPRPGSLHLEKEASVLAQWKTVA